MTLPITKIGDPVLRTIAGPLEPSRIASDEVQEFIDQLVETKREANGAGIAAPQVGKAWRIFVVENVNNPRYPYKPNFPLTVVINPKITFLTEERFNNFEGCLSIPDLRGKVTRCPEIRVEGYGRDGNPIALEVRGISAGTFQHEDDHLNGILFLDRVADPRTLCTWDEFHKHFETAFRVEVEALVNRYGS